MTTFPGSPRLLNSGISSIDPNTSAVRRIIALRCNPDTLTRSLQVKGVDSSDRSEALMLKGLPVEFMKLDAEIHAKKGWNP